MLIGFNAIVEQCVTITIVSVLRDLQFHRRTVESYAPATGLYQMVNGRISAHVVIYHHPAGVHPGAYPVIKHERKPMVYQLGKVDRKSTRLNSSHANISY